jgi:hypothetical protein
VYDNENNEVTLDYVHCMQIQIYTFEIKEDEGYKIRASG